MENDVANAVAALYLITRSRDVMARFDNGQLIGISPVRNFRGRPVAIREIRISRAEIITRINFRPDGTVVAIRPTNANLRGIGDGLRQILAYERSLAAPATYELRERLYVHNVMARLSHTLLKIGW